MTRFNSLLKRFSFIVIGLVMFLVACEQVIDLEVEQRGGEIVITGRVSNSSEGNYVSVHRTAPGGQEPEPIIDARVNVFDESGNVFSLQYDDNGRYLLESGFRGVIGEAYRLEVTIRDEVFETDWQTMPVQVGRDTLSWQTNTFERITPDGVRIEENVVEVFGTTTFDNPPDEFYIRWDLEEAYTYVGTILPQQNFPPSGGQIQCFVINDLNEQSIFLHNGTLNKAATIPNQLLVRRLVDESFQAKHYFNLIKSNLTKEAYDYWDKLDNIVNLQGSIFDVAPAPVPGNVASPSQRALGFFEVSSVDTTRTFLTNNDIPFFFFDPCRKVGQERALLFSVPTGCKQCLIDEKIVPGYCIFCGLTPNNTGRRPSYF